MDNYNAKDKFLKYDQHYRRMLNKRPSELIDAAVVDAYSPPWLEGVSKDLAVLDVGCGYGRQLALLSRLGFSNLRGIEVSRSSYLIAGEELQGLAQLELADAFDYLAKKKEAYDLIILGDGAGHSCNLHLPGARPRDRATWNERGSCRSRLQYEGSHRHKCEVLGVSS